MVRQYRFAGTRWYVWIWFRPGTKSKPYQNAQKSTKSVLLFRLSSVILFRLSSVLLFQGQLLGVLLFWQRLWTVTGNGVGGGGRGSSSILFGQSSSDEKKKMKMKEDDISDASDIEFFQTENRIEAPSLDCPFDYTTVPTKMDFLLFLNPKQEETNPLEMGSFSACELTTLS
ncbi:hypothetical protein EJ110_NYTH37188 [Nymphaea thermarum]|nr:hypothetical protein EJ110_NYTH37188 [Nymphaea thermarum]